MVKGVGRVCELMDGCVPQGLVQDHDFVEKTRKFAVVIGYETHCVRGLCVLGTYPWDSRDPMPLL